MKQVPVSINKDIIAANQIAAQQDGYNQYIINSSAATKEATTSVVFNM